LKDLISGIAWALARKAVAQPKSLVIWADKGEYATRFCPEIADITQKEMDILSEEWKKTVSVNRLWRKLTKSGYLKRIVEVPNQIIS
jgi:aspartate aminotransferase-like enzyme